jgi:hypothetical protein
MVGRVCGLPYNLIIFHDFFIIYLLSLRGIKKYPSKKVVALRVVDKNDFINTLF